MTPEAFHKNGTRLRKKGGYVDFLVKFSMYVNICIFFSEVV